MFKARPGQDREEINWDIEDNKAGYFAWIKSSDQRIDEMVDHGYVRVEPVEGTDERTLVPMEADPPLDRSHMVHPQPQGSRRRPDRRSDRVVVGPEHVSARHRHGLRRYWRRTEQVTTIVCVSRTLRINRAFFTRASYEST